MGCSSSPTLLQRNQPLKPPLLPSLKLVGSYKWDFGSNENILTVMCPKRPSGTGKLAAGSPAGHSLQAACTPTE